MPTTQEAGFCEFDLRQQCSLRTTYNLQLLVTRPAVERRFI